MSSPQGQANGSQPETDPRSSYHEHYHGLQTGSYTDQQLRHASANHLHMTNRRFFVGPIPEGWLQGHRKSWYKSRLRVRNYTSQNISFSAGPVATHYGKHGDRPDSSLPDLDEEVTQTLTNTSTEATEEQNYETETDAEEGAAPDPVGELQTLTHPEAEASGDDPLSEEDTGPRENRGGDSEEYSREESGRDSGGDSGEDTDSTPKARTRRQEDIYGNDVASSSFVTAREEVVSSMDTGESLATIRASRLEPPESRAKTLGSHNTNLTGHSPSAPLTSNLSTVPSEADSTTQLLQPEYKDKGKQKSKASGVSRAMLQHHDPQDEDDGDEDAQIPRRLTRKMARFNLDDNIRHGQQKMRSKIAKTQGTISANRPHRRKVQDGEIVKAEKMLVCVEETVQSTLPADYTENDSLRMETRTVDKWREFLVVCRKCSVEHTPFSIQMYRTRVIPDVQRPNCKTPPYHEVRLSHKDTHVNLYSPLDKTIVIWRPSKRGTKIFILRPKSAAHSTEWYTFIRQVLGWRRPTSLPIHVPDLGVSLIFQNPFNQLEAGLKADNSDSERAAEIANRPAVDRRFAAATIIQGCMDMLEGRAEWAEVLKAWSKTEKMGLAWKRYDRLEWVFGVNEEKMYGTIAMQTSHELELRPRHHYSTTIRNRGIQKEPAPIEGFLVRLTSQKGAHQRMNKMFFKRLYFFTQDHYLFFCRPAKALPPAPPKCTPEDGSIPTAREILDRMPLSWDIDPYPLENGEIKWLSSGNSEFVKWHDEEAYAQVQKNVHNISQADGFIDMCRVQEVRHVYRGSCPADPNIGEGPAVDFHPVPRDSRQDDGATREFDDGKTFEMVLDNGLVIRLQAYDDATRDEWIKRLDALVKYWHIRCAEDATELQAVRQRNLKLLDIDEAMESVTGQFAKKWEVKKSEASPHLHNMCSLSGCRTIKMSGHLFRKPRRHTTFYQCHVILTLGKLLIFRSTLRSRTGTEIPHIHQELESTIELEDCYIYSGLITENDLLYGNQTFDSNNPGLHALPRVYLDSGAFTSRDGDTAITFVVWQPLKKSYFRAEEIGEQGKAKRSLRHVSTLGKHGRTIVFKARSRVEKDRWVMSISSEIDRLQEEKHEDIRFVSEN
ncbi:uncharacterized protein N7479_008607 [Penicillium vulpinum]|uniref:PH domain-containing protein n=1 Tax=Penicillium vulpinum TaxID=29845 RepID=A0A1V6RDY1_9EURO|nr:uncharacterized protein N7479_008607 [Penicillium vulpinum]KAJ5950194.1 hypothetical protein N7479_008607 [Penicillium vulpinum]OQD99386.1 hypothetical protein PENVUL_c064G00455 [Penicillium vulpinum]